MMSKPIYHVKLNYKCDEPSLNGRIYGRGLLEGSFSEFVRNGGHVTLSQVDDYQNGILPDDVAGSCVGFKVTEEGEVVTEITTHDNKAGAELERLVADNESKIKLTTGGIGEYVGDSNVIKDDYKLHYLFVDRYSIMEQENN